MNEQWFRKQEHEALLENAKKPGLPGATARLTLQVQNQWRDWSTDEISKNIHPDIYATAAVDVATDCILEVMVNISIATNTPLEKFMDKFTDSFAKSLNLSVKGYKNGAAIAILPGNKPLDPNYDFRDQLKGGKS